MKKKVLFANSKLLLLCLSCKSKISFYAKTDEQILLVSLAPVVRQNLHSKDCSEIGKICLWVVLFSEIGNFRDSVRLSRQLTKAVIIVKYITSSDPALWHAARDSKRKLFSTSIPQLQSRLLLTKT